MSKSNEAAEFFDKFAVTFDTFYEGKRNSIMQWIDSNFRKDIFLRYFYTFEQFGNLNNKTIIDIGCGSGVYLAEALKRGAKKVTGLDPAKSMLNLAENRLKNRYETYKYNLIENLFPFNGLERHDFAIVMGVMDYVEEPYGFIREIKNVVSNSACISFPSKHWLRTPLRKFRYYLRNCPVYFYDENKINDIAKNAGFDSVIIKKIEGAGMDYHVTLKNE